MYFVEVSTANASVNISHGNCCIIAASVKNVTLVNADNFPWNFYENYSQLFCPSTSLAQTFQDYLIKIFR